MEKNLVYIRAKDVMSSVTMWTKIGSYFAYLQMVSYLLEDGMSRGIKQQVLTFQNNHFVM